MASPMLENRVDPHKKAHYTLDISDRITDGEVGDFTGIRYNHKPTQSTSSRTTLLTPVSSSPNAYNLHIEDTKEDEERDVFVFTGTKTVPRKSYILVFDPTTQKATLEPLANSYTLNVSTKNGTDMSSTYPKIWPRKEKDDVQDVSAAAGDELVNEDASREDVTIAPDPDNPFDFRHFLKPEKNDKKSDDSEYNGISSPDYRTGTGSAINTPQVAAARKPATSGLGAKTKAKAKAPTQAAPKAKKRKSPEPEARKTTAKKPPTVRLERRATTDPKAKSEAAKPAKKAAAQPPASKIKSAEIVHSSDESDEDADGEPEHEPEPVPSPQPVHRSPSPPSQSQHQSYEPASDEDEDDEMEDADDTRGGLDLEIEFEIPDERPAKPKQTLRPNLGYLASPANGPISLASAASSVEGTPRRNRTMDALENDDGVIDFGDMGGSDDDDADGEVDDHDVVPMDLGPPAQTREIEEDADAEMEEEDPLYKEMMEGLAGGDSSEESEEE